MVGASCRQGPHQGAQKSTKTGTSLCTTSVCQLSDDNSRTFVLAMIVTFSLNSHGSLTFHVGKASRTGVIIDFPLEPQTAPKRRPAVLNDFNALDAGR